MEVSRLFNSEHIVGVSSRYNSTFKFNKKVNDLKIKNIEKRLKLFSLKEDILNKEYDELSISEAWKIELISKLDNDVIIIGNISTSLINKDIENLKIILKSIVEKFQKKIIIVDSDINVFFNLVEKIYVIRNDEIVYETKDFYDKKLYEFVNIPKIVEFIEYVNESGIKLDKNIDIYELIKDIYRSVS